MIINKFFKISILSLLPILFITFSSGIKSDEFKDDEIEYEVDRLMVQFEKPVLSEIANNLIMMASDEDSVGDFYNSVKHFRQAIYLRKSLGLLNKDIQTANLLFLTSLSEYHLTAYCDARDHANDAYEIYRIINNQTFLNLIKNELDSMREMCENSTH